MQNQRICYHKGAITRGTKQKLRRRKRKQGFTEADQANINIDGQPRRYPSSFRLFDLGFNCSLWIWKTLNTKAFGYKKMQLAHKTYACLICKPNGLFLYLPLFQTPISSLQRINTTIEFVMNSICSICTPHKERMKGHL